MSVSVADPVFQHQPAQPAQPAIPIQQQVQQQAQQQVQLTPVSVSSSHNQLALPAPLPSANETISEPIQIFIENTNVPSGVPPTTSSPKEQQSVNVGLVIDEVQGIQNVQNEVTVKQDLDNSVHNDI